MTSEQPSNFQIRVRDSNLERIKTALGWFLTDTYFIFRHSPNDDNIHHHIYLFGIYRTAETIRKRLAKTYQKQDYSVKAKAGKKGHYVDITPMIAYQYAMKPASKPVLVEHKGWTEENMKAFELNAKEYYDALENPPARNVVIEDHYVVRPDRVWERLKTNLDKYEGKSTKEIKALLAAEWLNNGKAIMRTADANRYAASIFYLCKYRDQEVPDTALLGEFNDYKIEN